MIASTKINRPASAAETDLHDLLDYTRIIVEERVARGETAPFAITMLPSNATALVATPSTNSTVDCIETLKSHLKACARDNAFKATAIAYNVSVQDRKTGHMKDAIAVNLDHRQDISIVVYFPYEMEHGSPRWGTIFQQAGRSDIFQ